ncbi:uncharacterized protein F4822DRAFT_386022 [Hypoxylon trugodes]|uniref:uncharacterized protein n=1 Tax=Hypoxylon trugodes TaxID=326681 RepID=UPI0021978145|nr:uncharacterized protein F4822DRAFT_386022 [Hypoxylon trugodes]KAI1393808.1 hypothetical protein F4822DRAFT_386022 [Hypoxylon trugodes]
MVTTRSASKAASSPPPSTKSPSIRPWTHTPSHLTLLWFAISLPLVIWDSGYVLLRPLTMEGGSLHWPLYVPYKLYGEVDHVYGWKAFRAKSGFTSAQGLLNVVETGMYFVYLYVYFTAGKRQSGVSTKTLSGRSAAVALLFAFSAAVMTLSKTVLYWLQEYYSGFDNIGHNKFGDLVLLWIIPNGLWIVFPTYMVYVMGSEIIEGLATASTGAAIKSE